MLTLLFFGSVLAEKNDDPLHVDPGFDEWGYNYQAHIFNGSYCNYARSESFRKLCVSQGWGDIHLIMKWNDALLSNKDRDGDGKLDRHWGHDSYIGSGAWLTNHQKLNGKLVSYVKIKAKPTEDFECNEIWGDFCIIIEVNYGQEPAEYVMPIGPGVERSIE
jgi:hypothetical protein